MSAICSLINSTSKLYRVDERVAKGTFPTLRLEPFDGLVELANLGLIIALIRVLEKMIGRAIGEWRDFGSLEKRIVPTSKI